MDVSKTVTLEEARCILSRGRGIIDDEHKSDLINIRTRQSSMKFAAGFFAFATILYPLVSLDDPLWSTLIGTAVYFGFGFLAFRQLRRITAVRELLEAHGVENLSELEKEKDETRGI